ncbi:hypothetical protein niasHT_008945 [Heterodera trifolii]|uniref:Uncharacterized protein n=1 Tax=Heterodera trifolii TaxID=157864 RepID=A0ABD2LYI2_9BILA
MGEMECREAAEQVAERIRQCGYQEARIHEFAVKNFMATADVDFHIRLGPLSDFLGAKYCSFTPELFPVES